MGPGRAVKERNTKSQTPKKSQVPSSKPRPAIRAWSMELLWSFTHRNVGWATFSFPSPRPSPSDVFSVIAGRANGARTLVRRMVGHRRGLEISKRGSALPAFLRDKSRAPGEFSVGALNRYLARSGPASARTFVIFPWCRRAQRASAGDHAPDLNKSLNDE